MAYAIVPSLDIAASSVYGLPTAVTCGNDRTLASIVSMRRCVGGAASPPGSCATTCTVVPACAGAYALRVSSACCDSVPGSEKSLW